MKDSPQTPQQPDYMGVARTQAQASNPNVFNPLGSQTVTWNGDIPTINQTLTPEMQELLAQYQQRQGSLNNVLQNGLGWIQQNGQFNPNQTPMVSGINGLPQTQGSINPTGQQTSFSGYGPIQTGLANPGNIRTSIGNSGPIQSNLDYSAIDPMMRAQDFASAGKQAQDAIYSRMDPLLQKQEEMQRQQLANQGIGIGSEAYTADMNQAGRNRNDAINQAILAGNQLQNQLFGQSLAARQQGVGEVNTQGQFANQAQQQKYLEALGAANFANQAQQQNFLQGLAGGQFANQSQNQQYLQALGQAQFGNQALQNQFGQNLAAGQYGQQNMMNQLQAQIANANIANQANQQQYNQQLGTYQLPFNLYNSMQGASQLQLPQYQGFQTPNYLQGAQLQGQAANNIYNSQVGQQNAQTQGLFGLGAAALPLLFL